MNSFTIDDVYQKKVATEVWIGTMTHDNKDIDLCQYKVVVGLHAPSVSLLHKTAWLYIYVCTGLG